MSKPYKTFPLTKNPNGQWSKKHKGDVYYFGVHANPDAALKRFELEWPEILAGRTHNRHSQSLTVLDAVNYFLGYSKDRFEHGDISSATYGDYLITCEKILDLLGRKSPVSRLTPADFVKMRLKVRASYSPSRTTKVISVTRMVFKHAVDYEYLDRLPRYGPDFKAAKRRDVRLHREASQKKLLTRDELAALISSANPQWRAIILLCANTGMGNSDIARVRTQHVRDGLMTMARGKTGVSRSIPLWPETIDAIDYLKRKEGDLLFVSSRGTPLNRPNPKGGVIDLTVEGFRRVAVAAGIHRKGMGMYWIRHTFQTIGDAAKDPPAVAAIMGHIDASMSAVYREEISRERLQAAVDHVRNWLLPIP